MTKLEAIRAMREGKKVRHYYFSPDEWMSMTSKGMYLLEDSVVCSPAEFWKWRSEKEWDSDWEIYTE
jgi:predicted RNA-binding protein with EMAP domain